MVVRLKIEGDMVRGRFLSRTSRFSVLAEPAEGQGEAEEETEIINCHLPNPGRLKELLVPGAEVLLLPAKNPDRRKTKFDLFAVVMDGGTVVVDSRIPNRLIRGALESGDLPGFSDYSLLRSEPSFGESRLDFLLAGERPRLVEVKSCTLVRDGVASSPTPPPRGDAATSWSFSIPACRAIEPPSSSSSRGRRREFSCPTTRPTPTSGLPSGRLPPEAWSRSPSPPVTGTGSSSWQARFPSTSPTSNKVN